MDSYCVNELEAELIVTLWNRMDFVNFEVPSGPVTSGSVMQSCLLTEKCVGVVGKLRQRVFPGQSKTRMGRKHFWKLSFNTINN